MNITRDVVTDLLPLYFSGEASVDSRALVDAFFREHPDFEKVARKSVKVEMPVALGPDAVVEKKALQRLRRTLRVRSMLLGVSLFCTLAPFSVAGRDGEVTWFMLRDLPEGAAAFAAAALLFWGAYLWTFRARKEPR